MFGMLITNHYEMTGENISVKLNLFDTKIDQFEKIRLGIYDEHLIEEKEILNCGEDEYSSPFIIFENLEKKRKYKIVAEYYTDGIWTKICECYTSTATNIFEKDLGIYSKFEKEELPVPSASNNFTPCRPIIIKEVVS